MEFTRLAWPFCAWANCRLDAADTAALLWRFRLVGWESGDGPPHQSTATAPARWADVAAAFEPYAEADHTRLFRRLFVLAHVRHAF